MTSQITYQEGPRELAEWIHGNSPESHASPTDCEIFVAGLAQRIRKAVENEREEGVEAEEPPPANQGGMLCVPAEGSYSSMVEEREKAISGKPHRRHPKHRSLDSA